MRLKGRTTILDKINGTSGPPLPPFQRCQNGALSLLRAFIIALGGMGDNCSILYCPRLSEEATGVTRSYVCYADHTWSVVARSLTKGKRTLAELKSNDLCSRLTRRIKIKSQHGLFLVSCTLLIWKLNMHKCVSKCCPWKANLFLYPSEICFYIFYCWSRGKSWKMLNAAHLRLSYLSLFYRI